MKPRALAIAAVALGALPVVAACSSRPPVCPPARGPSAAAPAPPRSGPVAPPAPASADPAPGPVAAPDRVLTMRLAPGEPLAADRGAAGLWQQLLDLGTSHSVLVVTAHPDDELAGGLTWLARGRGVRVALVSLTRGEGGDNATGPEVFDALGLLRSEELRVAARHYGLDDVYFTALADFGYSKRLDEALERWDREAAVAELARVIRVNRPEVVIARYGGAPRDGHGHHQAAGLVAREAFDAAGDPARFPEQLGREGLRPHQARKLYVVANEGEPFTVEISAAEPSPWLGETYRRFGWRGWSQHRTQTGGRGAEVAGADVERFRRVDGPPSAPREAGLFAGLPERLPDAVRRPARRALAAFRLDDPAAVAPHLAAGLRAARAAHAEAAAAADPDLAFELALKDRQYADALAAALGVELTAIAEPPGAAPPAHAFAPPATLGAVVPGQEIALRLSIAHRGRLPVTLEGVELEAEPAWRTEGPRPSARPLAPGARLDVALRAWVPSTARPSWPAFRRASPAEPRYDVPEPAAATRPFAPPPLVAAARLSFSGVPFVVRVPVERREDAFPAGVRLRQLAVAPALSVRLRPAFAFAPVARAAAGASAARGAPVAPVEVEVEVEAHGPGEVRGELRLVRAAAAGAPAATETVVAALPFDAAPGRPFRRTLELAGAEGVVRAIATADGVEHRAGQRTVGRLDLEPHALVAEAATRVRLVEVAVAARLRVGYVTGAGAGEEVPAALRRLGADVTLLGERDLAGASLAGLDAILVGPRAYAVRPDLRQHNGRLLDYARRGGHLVVLYQTPEYDPARQAPVPAVLPAEPEEACEEDAPVELLAPGHPLLGWPNRITAADFEGWIEQRGSKFLASWDPAYTPLVSLHDRGQDAQRGAFLSAPVGQGHFTYCALALHRQLPHAVPGAVRLLANLVSRGRAPAARGGGGAR